MALTPGLDTWITIDEADKLLDNNIDAEIWFELPDDAGKGRRSKTSVLVTAFNEIIASNVVTVEPNSNDKRVHKAQAEMALFLLENYRDLRARRAAIASGLSDFTYSKKTESFNTREGGGVAGLPLNVIGLLDAYSNANTTVELQS